MLIRLLQKRLQHCFSSARLNSAFAYLPTAQSRPAVSCHVSLEQAGAREAGAQWAAHSWEHHSWNLSLCETLYCNKIQAVSKAGSDCGHHPSSHSPGQKSLFYTSAAVTGEKLFSSRVKGYIWLFPPLRKGELLAAGTAWPVKGTHFHQGTCPHAVPWGRKAEAEIHCPEQPLTERHKHSAKGKGTTSVLAQAWICLTPGSSMDVSDLQPCGTCLYNPSLLCAICFPFGRLAIRDSMLKLVSP